MRRIISRNFISNQAVPEPEKPGKIREFEKASVKPGIIVREFYMIDRNQGNLKMSKLLYELLCTSILARNVIYF